MGKLAPTVILDLDRERKFVFNFLTIWKFEDASGKNFSEMSSESPEMAKDLGVRDTSYLIWAGLVQEDEELTAEDVAKMIHTGNIKELTEDLMSLMGVVEGKGGNEKK